MSDAGDLKLGLESLKGFGGNFVQAIIGFVGTIVFARLLGPTSFGGFYFLLTLATFTDRPMRGFVTAAKKRYSEDNAPRSEIVGAVFVIVSVVGIPLSIGALFAQDFLVEKTNVPNAGFVFVLLLLSLILFVFFQNLLGAAGQPARQIWLDALRSLFTFPLQLAFVLAGFGVTGMGYGLAGASLLAFVIAYRYLPDTPTIPTTRTLRSLWSYAQYSIPATIVGKAYNRLDILLLGFLLSSTEIGYYEVAFKLTIPATFLYAAITTSLMPKVSNLHSRGKQVGHVVTNSLSYASLIAIPLFFGAVSLPTDLVVTLYEPEYKEATTFLIGLALYQVLGSQSKIYQTTLRGLDLPNVGLRIDTVSLVLNVITGVALIYVYGAVGVVIATVAAESLRLVLSAYAVNRRVAEITLLPRSLIEQVMAGIVMFIAVEYLSENIVVSSWIPLILLVSCGAGVYAAVLVMISRRHRQTFVSILQDIKPA